jgi:excisionase family DNA binding protein
MTARLRRTSGALHLVDVASDPGWWGDDDALPDDLDDHEAALRLIQAALPEHRGVALLKERDATAAPMRAAEASNGAAATEAEAEATLEGAPLPTIPPGLLTISEAAARLRVGRCTMQRLVLDGSVRSFKIGTKLRRIPPEAIDEFVARSLDP